VTADQQSRHDDGDQSTDSTTDASAYRNDVKHPLNQTRSFVFDWFDRL
jgi:hypothetical protein